MLTQIVLTLCPVLWTDNVETLAFIHRLGVELEHFVKQKNIDQFVTVLPIGLGMRPSNVSIPFKANNLQVAADLMVPDHLNPHLHQRLLQ
jgi:hypothetical protein